MNQLNLVHSIWTARTFSYCLKWFNESMFNSTLILYASSWDKSYAISYYILNQFSFVVIYWS